MIASDHRSTALSTIPAPLLSTRGPVQPGDEITVKVPLSTLPGMQLRDTVSVLFHAEGAAVVRERYDLPPLRPGESAIAETKLRVLPLNGHATVKVWADVSLANRRVSVTDVVEVPILARSRLSASATAHGGRVVVTVTNTGHAASNIRLELLGSGVPACDDLQITEDRAGRCISAPFPLEIDVTRTFTLVGARIDHLVAIADDGERASVQPSPALADAAMRLTPDLHLDAPDEGVRRGDLVRFEIPIENDGTETVTDIAVRLDRVAELALVSDSLTIDGALVNVDDLAAHDDVLAIHVGRLEPATTTILRGAYRVEISDPRELDALPISGTISAPHLPTTYRVEGEVIVDRRPSFAPTTTYFGQIEPDGAGGYVAAGMITNSEPYRIDRLRLRLEFSDVHLNDELEVEGRDPIALRSLALIGKSGLFADFGGINSGERIAFRIGLRLAKGDDDSRTMRIKATMQVDDDFFPLGTQECRVPSRADLSTSRLECLASARTLRLGMPVEARLSIANTGDSPARDIRLALQLPPGVGASIPESHDGGRWRKITRILPPGGEIATTVTFFLIEPIAESKVHITASIDADGFNEVPVGEILFATPSDPLIDPPALQAYPLPDGRIAMIARVSNFGDGVARELWMRADDSDLIVPWTTKVDGVLIDDVAHRSQLANGLALGTLEAGAYREVEWHISPQTDEPYRTRVFVGHEGADDIAPAVSVPVKPRITPALSTSLPNARKLTGDVTLDRTVRQSSARIIEEPADALGAAEHLRSLPAGSEHGTAPSGGVDDATTLGHPEDRSAHGVIAARSEESEPMALATGPAGGEDPRSDSARAHEQTADVQRASIEPPASAAPADQATISEPPAASIHESTHTNEGTAQDRAGDTGFVEAVAQPEGLTKTDEAPPRPELHIASPTVDAEANTAKSNPAGKSARDAADTSPLIPPAPTILVDRTTVAYKRAMLTARKLTEFEGVGWWRHIMAMRTLMAESIPGLSPGAGEAYTELRRLLSAPISKVYRRLFMPDARIDDDFIENIGVNDIDALAALEIVLAETPWITPNPIATGAMRLDHLIPNFLPNGFGSESIDSHMNDYKSTLTRVFRYAETINIDDAARREKYNRAPNGVLDDSLKKLAEAVEMEDDHS